MGFKTEREYAPKDFEPIGLTGAPGPGYPFPGGIRSSILILSLTLKLNIWRDSILASLTAFVVRWKKVFLAPSSKSTQTVPGEDLVRARRFAESRGESTT